MGYNRTPPTEAPPAYRYVTRIYGRSLRPVVIAICLVGAIWALAWQVASFKELKLDDDDNLPKLAPLAIAQGVLYAVACAIEVFGVVAAAMQHFVMVKAYAFLCALATLIVLGVSMMRVVTHFVFKSDLIAECTEIVQTGSIGSVFGIWGTDPTSDLNSVGAAQYCSDQWSRDSWAEIISLLIVTALGLMFTATAFAYYRQTLDPTSPANAPRAPSDQIRRDGYPTHYNPPYEGGAYLPVYTPAGPPPTDGKPPEYKRASYASYGVDKDGKDDPFSDYDVPSVPMPTHWVEDRDATPSRV